jgi:uncharacterized protein GlcG (DUF336 family)
MLIPRATFAAGAMLLLASNAIAQEVRVEKNISLALASDAAAAAMQFCADKGWKVSVTVVDRAGNVKVLLRSDNAGPHTVDSSRRKAIPRQRCSKATNAMMGIIEKNPGLTDLKMIDGFLLLGGGQPIRVGNEVIGAIAVARAPAAITTSNARMQASTRFATAGSSRRSIRIDDARGKPRLLGRRRQSLAASNRKDLHRTRDSDSDRYRRSS